MFLGNIMWAWCGIVNHYPETCIMNQCVIQLSGTENKQDCSKVTGPGILKCYWMVALLFDDNVIFINTQIPPHSANENQRFSKMKKAPVPHSKAR